MGCAGRGLVAEVSTDSLGHPNRRNVFAGLVIQVSEIYCENDAGNKGVVACSLQFAGASAKGKTRN